MWSLQVLLSTTKMHTVYNSFHCIKVLAFSTAEELNIRFEKNYAYFKQKKQLTEFMQFMTFSTTEL